MLERKRIHCKKAKLIFEGIVWNILETLTSNRAKCTMQFEDASTRPCIKYQNITLI